MNKDTAIGKFAETPLLGKAALQKALAELRNPHVDLSANCRPSAAGYTHSQTESLPRTIAEALGEVVWRKRSCYCTLSFLIAFALTTQHATAEQFAPYDEIKRKSAIFEPQPTTDTTPVTVKVVDITYQIPRNYLTHLDPAIPTLKLTWPGLKPLTEETRKCFGSILQSEQAGCTSLEFHLLGSRGPAPGGRAFTNAEMFENFMRGFKNNVPRPGPFGTEIYDIGPEEARIEIYRKSEGDIYFDCTIFDNHGKRGAVCADMFRLDDMNHVQFYFRPPQIEHIPEIEAGIRRLMAGFVVEGGQR